MIFVVSFWCPCLFFLLFFLFLSSLRVSNCFVFPLFIKKSLPVLSLLFQSVLVLTLFLWPFFFFQRLPLHLFWNLFFTRKKTCHSFCVLVFSILFFNIFFFVSLVALLFVFFFRCLQCVFVHFLLVSVPPFFFFEKITVLISFFKKKKIWSPFSILFIFLKWFSSFFPLSCSWFLFFTLDFFFALSHALCCLSSLCVFFFNKKRHFLLCFLFHFWSLQRSHFLCLFPSSFLCCLSSAFFWTLCLSSIFLSFVSFLSVSSFSPSHFLYLS